MIVFPTMITMGLAGVWHGAGLQFLVFGLLHGLYLTVNHFYRTFGPRVPETPPHPFFRFSADIGKIALTYLAVVVAQVFFRAPTLQEAVAILKGMAGLSGRVTTHIYRSSDHFPSMKWELFLCFLFLVVWTMPNSLQIMRNYEPTLSKLKSTSLIKLEWKPNVAWGFAMAVVALVGLLAVTGVTEFLYFRF
jgi:alginate O-acetyltransferase complex protein AlgI